MFSEIESNREELGVASYGASVTTLEEVFIKVGDEYHSKEEEETNKTHKDLFRQLSEKGKKEGKSATVILYEDLCGNYFLI